MLMHPKSSELRKRARAVGEYNCAVGRVAREKNFLIGIIKLLHPGISCHLNESAVLAPEDRIALLGQFLRNVTAQPRAWLQVFNGSRPGDCWAAYKHTERILAGTLLQP